MDDTEIHTDITHHKSKLPRFIREYGRPPEIINTFKEPSELWGLQEDIILHASGRGNEAKTTVEGIYKVLEQNNIFVIEASDKELRKIQANESCEQMESKKIGTYYRLLIGSVDFYRQKFGFTEIEARHYQWRLLGHAVGHAIDTKYFPEITNWGTEVRQQMFNLKYAQAVGDKKLEDMEKRFFKDLYNSGVAIN